MRPIFSVLVVAGLFSQTVFADPTFIFNFGDGWSSTGFNTAGAQPSISNPFGNPAYPGNTVTGNPNWLHALTLKYNKTLTYTWNFAVAGATIDNSIVAAVPATIPSVTDQVTDFLNNYSGPAWDPDHTLFSIFVGLEDFKLSWNRPDINSLTDTLLTTLWANYGRLYDVGARHFLINAFPPIHRTPASLANPAIASAQQAVLYNWNLKHANTYYNDFVWGPSGRPEAILHMNPTYVDTVLDNLAFFGLNTNPQTTGNSPSIAWYDGYNPGVFIQDFIARSVSNDLVWDLFWG